MNIEENIIEKIIKESRCQKQLKVIHDRQLTTVNRQLYQLGRR